MPGGIVFKPVTGPTKEGLEAAETLKFLIEWYSTHPNTYEYGSATVAPPGWTNRQVNDWLSVHMQKTSGSVFIPAILGANPGAVDKKDFGRFGKFVDAAILAAEATVVIGGAYALLAEEGVAASAGASATASGEAVATTETAVAIGSGAGATSAGGTAAATTGVVAGSAAASSGAASGAASATTGAVAGSAAANSAGSSAAAAGAVGEAIAAVKEAVQSVKDFVAPVVETISDTVGAVTGLVRDINDGLIQPIAGTIASTVDQVKALQTTLSRDLSGGIRGLVDFSKDLADGLTSLDATWSRGLQQLGATQKENIEGPLRSAMQSAVGDHLTTIAGLLGPGTRKGGPSTASAPLLHLESTTNVDKITKDIEVMIKALKEYDGLGSGILQLLADFLTTTPILLGFLSINYAQGKEAFKEAIADSKLSPSQATEAWRRKIIDDESVDSELRRAGFNPSYREVLKELQEVQISTAVAIELWQRDLINDATLFDLLDRQGVQKEDFGKLIAASETLRTLTQAINEYSIVSEADRSLVFGREELYPPGEIQAAGFAAGHSVESITSAWRLQWYTPSASTACDMWFRGLITFDQLTAFLNIANVPARLQSAVIDAQRPALPVSTAIRMNKVGLIDDAELHRKLAALGYSNVDIERLIKLASADEKVTPEVVADELHGLTRSTVLDLYSAGTLDGVTAEAMLTHIGLGVEAARLAIELNDLKAQAAERKAETDFIVARANAGLLDMDSVQSELLGLGLSTAEAARAYTSIVKSRAARTKLPGEAALAKMWKHKIIDDATYLSTLALLGYSEVWAGRMLNVLQTGEEPT